MALEVPIHIPPVYTRLQNYKVTSWQSQQNHTNSKKNRDGICLLTGPAKTNSLVFLQYLSPKKEHELKSETTSMLTIFSSVNRVSYCKFVDVELEISVHQIYAT